MTSRELESGAAAEGFYCGLCGRRLGPCEGLITLTCDRCRPGAAEPATPTDQAAADGLREREQ